MLIRFHWKHLGFKDSVSGLACTRAVLSSTQASEWPNSVTLVEQIIRRKLVDRDKKACVEKKRKSQEKDQWQTSLGLCWFAMRCQLLLWTGHSSHSFTWFKSFNMARRSTCRVRPEVILVSLLIKEGWGLYLQVVRLRRFFCLGTSQLMSWSQPMRHKCNHKRR